MKILVLIFLLTGCFLLFFNFSDLKKLKYNKKVKRPTAKEFVKILNGENKEGYIEKNIKETRNILKKTGSESKMKSIIRQSVFLAIAGVLIGLFLKNIFLAVVLGAGFYFLPQWITRLSLYNFRKIQDEELEVALSLITTSYIRNNDIVKSIEENMKSFEYPVLEHFESFINNIKYINSDILGEIYKLKNSMDNKIFKTWCDMLILCREDHTLKATLLPTVRKFTDVKSQSKENDTLMMLPLQSAVQMVIITLVIIPLLYMLSPLWIYSMTGKIAISITALTVLKSIDKAISLSKPIEFDV